MSNIDHKHTSLSNLELLERSLGLKQLQIKGLLNITQAINGNLPAEDLFQMYKGFLSWELELKKMALFIRNEKGIWECVSFAGIPEESLVHDVQDKINSITKLHNIVDEDHPLIGEFDLAIPIKHKETPIAYSFIGELDENDEVYEKVSFITTITNIIAVAIENKRLFKEQLEQESLKKEMELAGAMQQMLIPSQLPSNHRYELASIYQPHSKIGGDYFDFIDYDDPRFSFCVADVSGKGAAAALLMANIQATIRYLINTRIPATDFIRELNKSILESAKGEKFITFFIGEYNTETNELLYVNAGHNPPVLYTKGEAIFLDKGCTILGIFPEIPNIEVGKITLDEDAMILLFTDGLIDLQDNDGNYYDESKIQRFIEQHAEKSAKEFNKTLQDEIEAFREDKPFPDDISILTCKIHKGGVFIE